MEEMKMVCTGTKPVHVHIKVTLPTHRTVSICILHLHLVDAFIQSEDSGSNQRQQESNDI